MSTSDAHKSSLFLLELLLMILFFSIAAAICVQLFASAHTTSQKSQQLTHAVCWSENVSSVLTSQGFSPDTLKEYWPQGTTQGTMFCLSLTKDWDPCTDVSAPYILQVSFSSEDDFVSANLQILQRKNDTEIYQLKLTDYQETLYES